MKKQKSKKNLRYETVVKDILIDDGVTDNILDDVNNFVENVYDIIKSHDSSRAWSKRIVNSESNSATLISQLPGEGNRLHHHKDWNEWWFIIGGRWEVECEGKKRKVKKGDVVFIGKNKWHKITAIGNKPALRLAVSKDKVAHIYVASIAEGIEVK